MELRILGTVDLWANGQSHALGSLKERHLLACLAYDVGRQIPADTLVERMWDGDTSGTDAGKRLQPYVSRLRRKLREVGGAGSPTIEGGSGTYWLEADAQSIDARRYATLAAQARSLADSGDDEQALRLVGEAEPLWRGEPLAGLPGLWGEQTRVALSHTHLDVALIRAGIALRRTRFAEAIGCLSPLAAQHPTDEALAEHLMLALYGRGRTAQALDVYQTVRRRLSVELASEPGGRLRDVQLGILRNSDFRALIPNPVPRDSIHLSSDSPPNNLPHRVPFVGRAVEMERIYQAAMRSRETGKVASLELIAGMPGIGKSALAIHAAHELAPLFPDGQLYIPLGAHAGDHAPLTPAEALDRLLRALGVPAERMPQDLDAAVTLWRSLLANRRMLILLDDAANTDQVLPLLPGNPECLVITTSRRRLTKLHGHQHVHLDVLSEEDAISLFQERIGDARASANTAVAEIARLCAYLPLAIEITASRLNSHPTWSITEIAQRVVNSDKRLREIDDSTGAIAQSFNFSYQWLSSEQQMVFRRLGLHSTNDISPHAASCLAGLDLHTTEHILEDLLNFHIIQEPAPHRYRLHDLLREFATNLAVAEETDEERKEAVDRLLDFYLIAADVADRITYPHRARIETPADYATNTPLGWDDRADAHQWLVSERMNLIAVAEQAWVAGPPSRAALFANALGGLLDEERHGAVADRLHQRSVSHWRSVGDERAEVRALIDLSLTHAHADRYSQAMSAADRALEMASAAGDHEGRAEALHQLAVPYGYLGDFHKSLSLQRSALELRLSMTDQRQQARAYNNMGITLLRLGEHDSALTSFQYALSKFRSCGDEHVQAAVLNNIGDLHRVTGSTERARASYDRAWNLARKYGHAAERATIQMNRAKVHQLTGQLDGSLDLYRQALSAFRSIGERRREMLSLDGIGITFRMMGHFAESAAHHRRALDIAEEIRAGAEKVQILLNMALLDQYYQRKEVAIAHAQHALQVAEQTKSPSAISEAKQILTKLMRQRQEGATG
ncbi:tetratricopeptide repeat protein [Streptomyces sp. B6B3]|uniref:AfsR/SARP family transcriptional regulator n=1 Tax=Streptomyces sp. B6B3 TaxID=3153570 RepID=UPI00325C3DBB